jgi:hypothetical protein
MADNRKLRDFKNYRTDSTSSKIITILIITALIALLSWMTQRDNHPLKDSNEAQSREVEQDYCQEAMMGY